MSYYQGAMN